MRKGWAGDWLSPAKPTPTVHHMAKRTPRPDRRWRGLLLRSPSDWLVLCSSFICVIGDCTGLNGGALTQRDHQRNPSHGATALISPLPCSSTGRPMFTAKKGLMPAESINAATPETWGVA